jgi:hypothetical protein
VPDFDQFGVGLMAYSDKAGDGALNSTYLGLSVAYHKALGRKLGIIKSVRVSREHI